MDILFPTKQQILKPLIAQVPRILNPIVAVIESIPRFVFYIVVCSFLVQLSLCEHGGFLIDYNFLGVPSIPMSRR